MDTTNSGTTAGGDGAAPATANANTTTAASTTQAASDGKGVNTDGQTAAGEGNGANNQGDPGAAGAAGLDFSDLPEGMSVNNALLEKFTAFATESKLPPESTKALAALYKAQAIEDFKAQAAAVQKMHDDWYDQCVADPEIGGPKGSKFDENKAIAFKAVEAFGSKGLMDLLKQSGFGNHPEFVRFCLKVGAAVSEDSVIGMHRSGEGVPAKVSKAEEHASILYPDMAKKA